MSGVVRARDLKVGDQYEDAWGIWEVVSIRKAGHWMKGERRSFRFGMDECSWEHYDLSLREDDKITLVLPDDPDEEFDD